MDGLVGVVEGLELIVGMVSPDKCSLGTSIVTRRNVIGGFEKSLCEKGLFSCHKGNRQANSTT